MTALVGIICADGIVVGSDSSATFTQGQRVPTIEQKVRKVEIISGQVILAGTGSIGLGQRFSELVRDYWQDGKGRGKSHIEVAKDLSRAGIEDFGSTHVSKGLYGALLAFPSAKGGPKLCEFALADFQPEFKDTKMWFVSMGSGQQITDPFLGFMRRVFWGDSPPSLVDGIFAVTWTLNHVIELNPGGINGPPQIAVLDAKRGTATLLGDAEIQEHINSAQGAEAHLKEYSKIIAGKCAPSIPPTPAAPNSKS